LRSLHLCKCIGLNAWHRLFAQVELLAKSASDFGKPCLAGVMDLWDLADQYGIPGNTRRPGYRYPSAIALRVLAQFGHDHTFEFRSALRRL
jgi:hypothetical protein